MKTSTATLSSSRRSLARANSFQSAVTHALLALLQQAVETILDDLFRLGNHALDDFAGGFDRINQTGVLTE